MAEPMEQDNPHFQLCATLAGHEQDVRAVGVLATGEVITGSRDMSVRLWRYEPAGGFSCSSTLLGHTHFVGAVAPVGTGVASGSNDKHVIEWDMERGTPARILEGHTDVVSCVRARGELLYSASWDKTARVWQAGACLHTLKGHEAAVWSVLPLEDGRVLTASADRTIKLWEGERCVQSYTGHEDVVRDLALLPGVGFLSASNDGSVRAWALGGDCLKVLKASETFVYGVAVLESGEWLTCAEDRTVRVWNAGSGECAQSIMHPSTVWGCAALPNGDLVAGCADGNAYVWTRAAARVAAPDLVAAFKEGVAGTSLPAQQAESMQEGGDALQYVDEDALLEPGAREGQQKFVRDNAGVKWLYQWTSATQSWEKIGEITGQDNSGASLGKKYFEGKEWDYVFDIDMHGTMMRLPFNRGDDPWMTAHLWLGKHDLDPGFLDQVAQHIIANTPGNVPTAAPVNSDPFTSGGAYRPGAASASSGGNAPSNAGVNVDPFTSGGAYVPGGAPSHVPTLGGANAPEDPLSGKRYRPGNASGPTAPPAAAAAPTYVAFDACKHDAALAKLLEFNEQQAGPAKLAEPEVTGLTALVALLKQGGAATPVTAQHIALFSGGGGAGAGLLAWPAKCLFPALDLLRLLLLLPAAAPHVQAAQPPLLPRLAGLLGPSADKATTLMVLRCFANALHCAQLRPLAAEAAAASAIMDTLALPIESGATGVRLAACSVLVNLAFALSAAAAAGGAPAADADALPLQALSVCAHALSVGAMLSEPAEEESFYRVLVALQALLAIGPSMREMAREMDLHLTLKALPLPPAAAQKVTGCHADLLTTLG